MLKITFIKKQRYSSTQELICCRFCRERKGWWRMSRLRDYDDILICTWLSRITDLCYLYSFWSLFFVPWFFNVGIEVGSAVLLCAICVNVLSLIDYISKGRWITTIAYMPVICLADLSAPMEHRQLKLTVSPRPQAQVTVSWSR